MRCKQRQTETGPKRSPRRKRERRSRGSSLVEMSLVMPILLMLTFGIIEMGRLFFAWVTVQDAARSATRLAIRGSSISAIKAKARDIMINRLPNGASIPDPQVIGDGGPCTLIEVRVQYTYQPLTPIVGSAMSPITLVGSDKKVIEPYDVCP